MVCSEASRSCKARMNLPIAFSIAVDRSPRRPSAVETKPYILMSRVELDCSEWAGCPERSQDVQVGFGKLSRIQSSPCASVGHSRCGGGGRNGVQFGRDNGHGGGGELQYAAIGRCEDAIREGARLCRGRRADLQRRPLWRQYRGREPVAPGQAALAVGRRVPGPYLWRQLPATPAHLDERTDVPLPVDRRLAERGHAEGEHLDA